MASSSSNRAIIFQEYVPEGLPVMGKHWTVDSYPEPALPLQDGQVLIKLRFLSVDPYLRGRMKDVKSYFPSFSIGAPGNSHVVVEVLDSKSDRYAVGSLLAGYGQWVERLAVVQEALASFWPVAEGLPASTGVGVLGMPGATAYFGYLELCQPKAGETLVVSGAAGAVGSLVCQLGKIKGCYVIGIAGTPDKLEYLKSIGVDVALDYHTPDLAAAIRQAAPNGVDQYFDNVGGAIKDAVFENLNSLGRVSACGAISSYNQADAPPSKNWEWSIITKQLRIEGFLCNRWIAQWPAAFAEMAQWIREGKLKFEETFENGFENVIPAFNKMMSGGNTGKMVVII